LLATNYFGKGMGTVLNRIEGGLDELICKTGIPDLQDMAGHPLNWDSWHAMTEEGNVKSGWDLVFAAAIENR
jgi:hypothetical protein